MTKAAEIARLKNENEVLRKALEVANADAQKWLNNYVGMLRGSYNETP